MNNKKEIVLCTLVTIFIGLLVALSFYQEKSYSLPNSIYQVYLDGEKIGMIDSQEELYKLINKEQSEIKDKYKVDQVYPPKGFQIIKETTYNEEISKVEDVYNSIKDAKEFTIKGYTITIKNTTKDAEPTYVYVLDDSIFKEAVEKIVTTFIGTERYEQYQNKTQPVIVDTGYTIENMYIQNEITVRESYVSTNEKIYTDVDDLTKFLLFGDNEKEVTYQVIQGDSIESIAESHKLNVQELLIANDSLSSEDTLLAIGQKINVALIEPIITLVYEELVIEDVEDTYETIEEKDSTQYVGYSRVKQEGRNGISRVTSRVQFINGAETSGAAIIGDPVVIRPVQNKIVVQGTKKKPRRTGGSEQPISGEYIDTGTTWAWPTNRPYKLTSPFGYRWGSLHQGIDISGTGYGSPIYASLGGVVVNAQYGGMVGGSAGKNVVIEHPNGYYTVYAHLSAIYVSEGQAVSRGQKIGAMGHTGYATGTHLHFGVYIGKPYNGGKVINPLRLWK
jgi:murein DD-endopeptidase MepM/ murein hydrolase activator NlpD